MSQPANHNRRRAKPILSCSFCRGRKLHCDRQSPCDTCIHHARPTECVYSSSMQERKDAVDYRALGKSQQARQRIDRLESIVTQLRDQMGAMERDRSHLNSDLPISNELSSESGFVKYPCDTPVAEELGRLNLSDSHDVYTGNTHWITILEDIQNLKDELAFDIESDLGSNYEVQQIDMSQAGTLPTSRVSLLSSTAALPRADILSMIPPRKTVDRHVSHFFNAFDFASSVLHSDRFFAEYSKFWEDPSTAPITWIGLLCSIMTISSFLRQQDTEDNNPSAMEIRRTLETYRTLTIHCLVAGNYLQPSRHTIEALTLHFAVNQSMSVDTERENWMLIGVIVRSALRIGLHRDPSHWPHIRPLEAEYRRRLWTTLYHMDFFTSTQVGLPRIIQDSQCDVRPPANLNTADLSFELDAMPPERPLTDLTPLSFIIQRSTIIKVAAEIYDATEGGPPSPAMVAALDAKLRMAIDSIPDQYKYRSLDTLIAESPVTILQRISLDILVHKATYLLHRRKFMKGTDETNTMDSNKLCINAALAILDHQKILNDESQPGGIMFGVRWRVASSLSHEFLQATMMLCLAMDRSYQRDSGSLQLDTLHRQQDVIQALCVAKGLWLRISSRSPEARRAVAAITSVLRQEHNMYMTQSKTALAEDGISDLQQHVVPVQSFGMHQGTPETASQPFSLMNLNQDQILHPDKPLFETNPEEAAFSNFWDDRMAEPVLSFWAEPN